MAVKSKRKERAEHFTKMVRGMMQTDAWRELAPVAQALYPWLKFEWHGPQANNNGKLCLSVRQAADCLGVSINTAARAFHDLEAKGFLVVTRPGALGVERRAKAPEYELTELPLPQSERNVGRRLYLDWKPGRDFPVHRTPTNNPLGRNGRRTKPRLKSDDDPVSEIVTFRAGLSQK